MIQRVLKSPIPLYITTRTFDSITSGREQQRQVLIDVKRVNATLADSVDKYPDLQIVPRASASESTGEATPPEWALSQLAAAKQIGGSYALDTDDLRTALAAGNANSDSIITSRDILRILQSIGAELPINDLAGAAQNRPNVFPRTLESGRTDDSLIASRPLVPSYVTLEAWAASNLLQLLSSWPGGIHIPNEVRSFAREQVRVSSLRLDAIALHEELGTSVREAVAHDRIRVCDANEGQSERSDLLSPEESEAIGEGLSFPALVDSRLAHITAPCEHLYNIAAATRSAIWTDDGATALFHWTFGPYIDEPSSVRLHASALAHQTPMVAVIGTGRALEELTKLGVFSPKEHLHHIVELLEAGYWCPVTELFANLSTSGSFKW